MMDANAWLRLARFTGCYLLAEMNIWDSDSKGWRSRPVPLNWKQPIVWWPILDLPGSNADQASGAQGYQWSIAKMSSPWIGAHCWHCVYTRIVECFFRRDDKQRRLQTPEIPHLDRFRREDGGPRNQGSTRGCNYRLSTELSLRGV